MGSKSIAPQMTLEKEIAMNPDLLCMTEIRGSEAFETVEATETGHQVLATIHADIPDEQLQAFLMSLFPPVMP